MRGNIHVDNDIQRSSKIQWLLAWMQTWGDCKQMTKTTQLSSIDSNVLDFSCDIRCLFTRRGGGCIKYFWCLNFRYFVTYQVMKFRLVTTTFLQKKELKACSTPFYATSGYCSEIFVWVHHIVVFFNNLESANCNSCHDWILPMTKPPHWIYHAWSGTNYRVICKVLCIHDFMLFWCPTKFLPEKKQLTKSWTKKHETINTWDFGKQNTFFWCLFLTFKLQFVDFQTNQERKCLNQWS